MRSVLLLATAVAFSVAPLDSASAQSVDPAARAAEIYHSIAGAFGDGRPSPDFAIEDVSRPAYFNPCTRRIVVDEGVLEVAESTGDFEGSMSFLLGHELAHFYADHGRLYGNCFGRLLGTRGRALEGGADILGSIASFVAGYGSSEGAPRMLEAVYQRYRLDEAENDMYPSLTERLRLAGDARTRVGEMIPLIEVSTHLTVLGFVTSAAEMLEAVAAEFPSREVLNNLGVSRIAQAIDAGAQYAAGYPVPLQVANETRASSAIGGQAGTRSHSESDANEIGLLLDLAEQSLTRAWLKDDAFLPIYVNLASLHLLRGDLLAFEATRGRASKAAARTGQTSAGLSIHQALSLLRQSDRASATDRGRALHRQATALLDSLSALGQQSATAVLDRVRLGSGAPEGVAHGVDSWWPDGVGELIRTQQAGTLGLRTYLAQNGEVVQVTREGVNIHLAKSTEGAPVSTMAGLSPGDPVEEVVARLGPPASSVLDSRTGQYLVYSGQSSQEGLAFHVAGDGRVKQLLAWRLPAQD